MAEHQHWEVLHYIEVSSEFDQLHAAFDKNEKEGVTQLDRNQWEVASCPNVLDYYVTGGSCFIGHLISRRGRVERVFSDFDSMSLQPQLD